MRILLVVFGILGVIGFAFVVSLILNFIPATIVYLITHFALGLEFTYWKVYWVVFLIVFVINLIRGNSNKN